MPEEVPLTQQDKDLLRDMAHFAERRSQNGIYFNRAISQSLGVPVVYVIAVGEVQANLLERAIMGKQAQQRAVEVFTTEDLTKING